MKSLSAALILFVVQLTCTWAEQPLSSAEQHLFVDHHFAHTDSVSGLHYRFARSGSMEEAFDDEVVLKLSKPLPDDRRQTELQFLSGTRAFSLPNAGEVTGNPVILSFLERDVREMQRHTKGQANYFRKRVRMALAEDAKVEAVHIELNGRTVAAHKITFAPYRNDPLRARYEHLAGKTYQFLLSDAVPGNVWEMRSTVIDAQGTPLMEEVLSFAEARP